MVNAKEKHVHEVFESISTQYDKMNGVISLNMHKSWRKDIMGKMSIPVEGKVLDVCCGTADWTIAISEELEGKGQVTGLDFSKNMLEVGKEKVKTHGLENVELVHGNAMELPFEDNSFHVVTIGFGLRNVPDPQVAIQEMYRVLKPGGQVVCLETSHPENPFFRPFYSVYFKQVMPRLGKFFAKSKEEYQWLHDSTTTFPKKDVLSTWFLDEGFIDVNFKSYAGGAAAGHWGFKPSEQGETV
ncbi:demethylmenaquinone methyltransferase [Geomicrobium sediminis]|uniref:Demethylmenaquinone methyltransferase n=1 Tax=Geomicrobium sediminis TaxID=1347788 RepID=A0ABS2PEP2_9BACL|nr:demethylmenaquinone methyltransferase/2-methoxy-6-polyprenyl-1,4-benzoquinol methylase [Geomicrobium sediminis]